MAKLRSVKGMHDLVYPESHFFRHVENCLIQVISSFAYKEIRLPILERAELFKRSVGESTDIVEKEMYSFTDRGGDELSLRPEGTAACVRAGLQHGLLRAGRAVRLWYAGPFFRRERPQKGRYRQFHQMAAEAYGLPGANVEAELILSNALAWQRLGCSSGISLKINTLGNAEERANYRERLIAYLSEHQSALDEPARQRLRSNPLRILDSKNEQVREILNDAPKIRDCLGSESLRHFDYLQTLLSEAAVDFEIDPHMVRGLDYYTQTVFEWVLSGDRGQLAVCAGGRYDNLVEQLSGNLSLPAAGFAIGIERLLPLLENQRADNPPHRQDASVYIAVSSKDAERFVWRFIAEVRRGLAEHNVLMHCGGGGLSSQLKHADRSGATLALIVGDDEVRERSVSLKFLREERAQEKVPIDSLPSRLRRLLPC